MPDIYYRLLTPPVPLFMKEGEEQGAFGTPTPPDPSFRPRIGVRGKLQPESTAGEATSPLLFNRIKSRVYRLFVDGDELVLVLQGALEPLYDAF